MDRRCAGALLALAACIASTAAAPTASNQTALDLYDGAQQGCYYNFQHYGEGDRIMTNEPCLNCTCHNRMLMCYLRVCPFTKPIGQDCSVEKRADQCCPIVTCPDVPVDLLTSTSTTSPAEYGETGLGKLDRYGCSINGKYFPEGAKVPPTPSKPCEHCYCIRNMTTCVMQECTLHVDGCTPIYHKDVCCPVRYSCDHPEDEIPLLDDMTTTVRPTPGFLLTTTTLSPVTQMTQDCVHDDKVFADGALIKTEKACEHCYCMKGDIVCVVQECGTPMENEGKNCTSMPPREGQCCPDTYICEGDELTTETKPEFTTEPSLDEITTLSPPRRVIVEGSGYRKEPGEPFTEEPPFEPDTEGSGEDEPFKPINEDEVLIPESETTRPLTTTDNDVSIDQYGSSTSRIPVVDSEMNDKATTEPDKGQNTVPSGSLDEGVPEMSISDKTTTPEQSNLATEYGLTTESYFDAKTTAIHEDESLGITDTITTEAEAEPTKLATESETSTAYYRPPTLSDDKATAEPTEVTESTQNKLGDENTPTEITTLEDKKYELTTKAATSDAQTTASTSPRVEQEVKITTSQQLPEQENEVLVKELTTESYLESSTKSDIIKTETESAATIAAEATTQGKEQMTETTSVNPVDNEIDEESYPTSSPGRIPGEGDCLLDGITYSNESIVPSSNNCHTSCKCISSIVKCDPIICSAPPDYMDNCQPMYDPPESCCPTYVCDHTKETIPPQSHSQMAGTESPVPTPSVECNGDQCEISRDKEDTIAPIDSSKKPDECGSEGCEGTDKKPDRGSQTATEECVGEKCISPQAITPDQICDSANGCKIPDDQACQGEDCKTQSEVSPGKDSSASCDNVDGCNDNQAPPPQAHCADGKCESHPNTNQICDSENGCQIPVEQACQGEDCKTPPEVIPAKDNSVPCDNADNCKEDQVPEGVPDCKGESCTSKTGPKDTDDCKDGNDCTRPEQSPNVEECKEEGCRRKDVSDISKPATGECADSNCVSQDNIPQVTDAPESITEAVPKQSPTVEECKEEGCRRKDVSDISKPATGECTDSNCVSQDNIPQVTDAPESITEAVPKTTDLSGPEETISNKPVIDLTKTPDVEKEVDLKITTEASIFIKDEESQSTAHYDETVREKEEESMPSATEIPEIKTQTPEVQQYTTEITMQKETTVTQSDVTPSPSEGSSTNAPKLLDSETDDRFADLPGFVESESPESVTKPTEQPLVDDYQTEVPQADIISDEHKHDLTTAMPSMSTVHDMATEISEDTSAYTAKDSLDTTTKGPEYLPEQDEIETESSTAVSSLDEVKEPDSVHRDSEPNVTESTESDTPTSEKTGTEKHDKEPIEQDLHDAVTTPKSYGGETNAPENLETVTPIYDVSQEQHDTHTAAPETLSTLPQEQQEEIEETELPGSIVTSDKPVTSTGDDMVSVTEGIMAPSDESETKSPLLPEVSASGGDDTRGPESTTILEEELYTMTPTHDISDEIAVTPFTISDKNKVPTESPMSITKDKEEGEAKPTQSSETSVPVSEQELTTQKSELPEVSPTESYGTEAEQKEPEIGETVKDSDKELSSGDEEHVAAVTEKADTDLKATILPVLVDESSSEQPSKENEIPEIPAFDASTETPITVSIVEQPTYPSDTEAGVVKPATPGQQTSVPVTSIPTEGIDTKSPESFTEIPTHTVFEDNEITDQPDEKEDFVTEIPELTIHEHTESTLTTEKSEQLDVTGEVATKMPDMSATEQQDISTQKEVEEVPEDSVTNAPDISAVESQKEVTKAPEQELVTKGYPLTEPGEYESKDITTAIPETPVTELQKEVTSAPEAHDDTTEVPETHVAEPEQVTTEGPAPQDNTISDSKISVPEPEKEVTETPETQDTSTNTPDTFVTEIHKDVTGPPDSQATIINDVSEEEPHKESTGAPDSLDIATNAPEISEPDFNKESSESPSLQDTTTNVQEISDAAVTEPQKEAPEEPQETATIVPETNAQEDVTELPETQDIATSAPKISVTEAQEEASEAPQSQDATTYIPQMLTTVAQKDETEISDDSSTHIPEISATESKKEATEAPVAPNIATDIPESPITELQTEVPPSPVAPDAATNIPETSSLETKKDMTETPVAQDVATEIPEKSATESQGEVTDTPVVQDVVTNIPEILTTEFQREVTELPLPHDHATNIPDTPATDSPKGAKETPAVPDIATDILETPATESQKEMTETPVAQDVTTKVPESLDTESQKEATEAPVVQGAATDIPEIPVTESQKDATEAPMVQDVATSIPETPLTVTEKDITQTPVAQDVATIIPETSATESQKVATEVPVTQDLVPNISEIPATESQKEATEAPFTQNVPTNIPEISATESQKEVTVSPEGQDLATNIPEITAPESEKEVTEAPMAQDIASNIPETTSPESQKDVTEASVAQNIPTNIPEISETESQKKGTEAPVAQDIATSVPEITATESQTEATETPVVQDIATNIPETSSTESQKEVTEAPFAPDVLTNIPEISATESQKEVTETPVAQDMATSMPETSATESQKEATEIPVAQDVTTSAPETSATGSQKEVTDAIATQDVASSIPETSTIETQKEATEAPAAQNVVEDEITESPVSNVDATYIPEIAGTESPKYDTTLSAEAELHKQSTKVPESLVTEMLDKTTVLDIATDKPTTVLQDSDDDKPKDDEKISSEIPIVESAKPDEHKEPEKSDVSTELPIITESVESETKSPQSSDSDSAITKITESPVTEHQPIKEEDDTISKYPEQSESEDQTTKTSKETEQTSEYSETTPYLVLLEEHTHKKDIYTISPDEEITTGASDVPSVYEPTTQVSVDKVTESVPTTEAELPSKQEAEKDDSADITEETISEKVTEPSLLSEEITTISPSHDTEEVQLTEKPQDLETNEISTAALGEEHKETDKPSTSVQDEADKLEPSATEKPHETTAPEEEFILATTKATTIKTEEDLTSPSLIDKYGKPDEISKPASEPETQKPDITDELPKPGVSEVQTTEEVPQPDSDSQFPSSGTSGYGQEPDYGEEDQAFGPGTCRYGGKVYVSAQQIPRDDPCDFCFCFRSDIICLQQSCPPPIHGCHEEPIQGFCCPRYECPVSMATTLNVTTTTTTTTTTLPPHFLPHAYKGAAQRRGCQIKGHTYKVGEVVRASSGPCLHCTCGGDGQMKCDPKVCTPEPMLRQMIAAAVSAKRRR